MTISFSVLPADILAGFIRTSVLATSASFIPVELHAYPGRARQNYLRQCATSPAPERSPSPPAEPSPHPPLPSDEPHPGPKTRKINWGPGNGNRISGFWLLRYGMLSAGQHNSGFALVSKKAQTKTKAKEREATQGTRRCPVRT
jgi:hypothetical protein